MCQNFSEAGINYFATTKEEECKIIRETLGEEVSIFLLNPTRDFELVRKYDIEVNIANLDYLKENIDELRDLTLQLEFAGSMRRAGAKTLDEVLEIINFCKETVKTEACRPTHLVLFLNSSKYKWLYPRYFFLVQIPKSDCHHYDHGYRPSQNIALRHNPFCSR